MPLYPYKCDCGHHEEILATMAEHPSWQLPCPKCEGEMSRDIQAQMPQVTAWDPYVEENFDGKPREIRSPKQRDELCEQFGVTYDQVTRSQRRAPTADPVISDDLMKEVYEETQGGKILPEDVKEACEASETSD